MFNSDGSISLLRQLRERLKVSTTQLAMRLNLDQSTVVRLEKSEQAGTITLESMRRLAAAMGFELTYSLRPMAGYPRARVRTENRSRFARSSRVAAALREDELKHVLAMSPEQKVLRALELSDLCRKMRNV